MLQLGVIRQNPDLVKERLSIRNFKQPELVDQIISLDEQRRQLQQEQDNVQSQLNTASKEIGQLMAKNNKEGAEVKKQEVAALKQKLDPKQLEEIEKKIQEILYSIPNLPNQKVPAGLIIASRSRRERLSAPGKLTGCLPPSCKNLRG